MKAWPKEVKLKKSGITFKDRVISSGYVIAKIINDDSSMYVGEKDPCIYLTENGNWAPINDARIYPNEATLALAIEEVKLTAVVSPIYIQTTITTVDTESFDAHIHQRKIAKAMSKLNEEDMVLLGLMGAKK